jgi:hypothetical protein
MGASKRVLVLLLRGIRSSEKHVLLDKTGGTGVFNTGSKLLVLLGKMESSVTGVLQ